jgi:hypothetical protein
MPAAPADPARLPGFETCGALPRRTEGLELQGIGSLQDRPKKEYCAALRLILSTLECRSTLRLNLRALG